MPSERGADHGLMTLLGRALSRDAAYYTIGMASVFPLGILTALLITRYLEPTEYGHLGLLMVLASLATVFYGLGVIQGTLMWAYGAAGDDGDDDDGADEELGPVDQEVVQLRDHRRRVMGSGVLLAVLIAIVGTGFLIAGASPIAEVIVGSTALRDAVMWAAVSAGLGSIWRLGIQVYRMERRAAMFLVASVSRPLFALVLTAVLLSKGYGLEGAIAATALATALSMVLVFVPAMSAYLVRFRPADLAEIIRRGRSYIPIILGVWLVTNIDLWVLSRASTGPEVGLYRLASRFGIFPSYVTSAYLLAWMPMQRSSLGRSAARSRTREAVSSTLFTYYCIGAAGLLIALTVCSELFIGFAPESYSTAAPYVPAVAAAVTAQGALYALYRIARIRRRRLLYLLMLTLATLVLASLGAALAGPLGGYGVALAGTVGGLMGCAGFVIAIRRSKRPIPFQWVRIAGAVAIAGLIIVLVTGSPATGAIRIAQDIVALAVYPLLLLATGVIPRGVVGDVLAIVRATVPLRPGRRRVMRQVETLPADEREAIHRWVGYEPQSEPSLEPAASDRDSLAALTRGIRSLIGTGDASERDHEIGAFLTHRGSHVDRDHLAERLIDAGVDPFELHLLDDAYHTVRQGRRLTLSRGKVNGRKSPPPPSPARRAGS